MDDISETVHTISAISKLNGGVGIGADEFRHSEIGNVGVSEGPCGFLDMYDKTIGKVRQGNTRNGAGTAFLSSWHYDFAEFVQKTDNFRVQRLEDLNTCGWMNDLFFVRVQNAVKVEELKKQNKEIDPNLNTDWTMFCPKKAEELKGKSGIEFIKTYEKIEKLAEEREKEYEFAMKEVSRVHTLLMSNPDDETLRRQYLDLRQLKLKTSKARIDHTKVNAFQLYNTIITVQGNSGMPYIMHADACQKSNQKNMGYISQSNLCLEILEVTKPHSKHTPAEIASCNLASMNIPRHVRGKIDWKRHNKYSTPEEVSPDLLKAFDFELYSKNVRSVVENLNEVVDHNYYPLDERDDEDKVIQQGPISTTNHKTRPLGIGVSGQSDALALMDCTYLGKPAIMFNKMLYACKYFNALVASMALAIRDGEYETFRQGSYKSFIGVGQTITIDTYISGVKKTETLIADKDGYVLRHGSPLSNGQFQFDLWREEAQMLKHCGLLNEKVYDVKDDIPLEPSVWGQQTLYCYVVPGIKNMKDIEITSQKRSLRFYESEIIIEPTWECLRQLIMKFGIRNSLLIALMPTASSANTLRNCESTEAHQSMIYTRDVKAGSFTILNRHLYYALQEINLWSSGLADFIAACEGTIKHIKHYILDHPEDFPNATFNKNSEGKLSFPSDVEERLNYVMEMFLNMYDISQKEVLKQVRQRGIYVCQSQSTNIYLKDPTPVQLQALHLNTNALRLKTGQYYLRQSPAKSAGNFTLPAKLVGYVKNLLGITNNPNEKTNINEIHNNSPTSLSKGNDISIFSRSNSPPSSNGNSSTKTSPIFGTCTLEDKQRGTCADCMV
jgi:ribonucleotide reductase alpha subunit